MLLRQLLLGIAALGVSSHIGAQASVRPLELDDIVRARSFERQGDFGTLSPDGRWLAYMLADNRSPTRSDGDNVYFTSTGVPWNNVGGSIWLTDVITGETRVLTWEEHGSNWNPTWSPDGRLLAFFSDRDGAARVWVWDRSTGAQRRVSDVIVRSYFPRNGIKWLPDSRRMLLKVLPKGITMADANAALSKSRGIKQEHNAVPGSTVIVYKARAIRDVYIDPRTPSATSVDTVRGATVYTGDLAILDVSTGRVAQRIDQNGQILAYRLSPDGTKVAVVDWVGTAMASQDMVCDIRVISLTGDQVSHVLAQHVPLDGRTMSWSPDGTMLAYITRRQGAWGDIYVVPVAGGGPRQLNVSGQADFYGRLRPPLWGPRPSELYVIGDGQLWRASIHTRTTTPVLSSFTRQVTGLVADASGQRIWSRNGGHSMYVETVDTATMAAGFYRVDLTTARVSKLLEEHKQYGSVYSPPIVAADGKTVAYLAQDAQHSEDIWVAGGGFQKPRRLTHVSPEYDRYALGASRLVEWRTDDGKVVKGALLLPSDYGPGRRYPMVVVVYPNVPHTRTVNVFGLGAVWPINNMQMLATRGYAVFYPDIPQRVGTPLRDIASAVLPGINKVIELGIADPDRLGVMGASYGGYATLALLVQTTRFKAAVMSAGVADLIGAYGEFRQGSAPGVGWAEAGQGLMGGPLWTYRDRYIENSPVFYLDRVQTPLLVVHGDQDRAVPVRHGEAVFIGLRRLGKEVELRRYAGEDHVIQGMANVKDYWLSTIRWFDTYLKVP